MELFTIEYEAPSFVYAPGQQVRGFVHIQLKEPMKAKAVTLHAMGVAHTNWTCNEQHIIGANRRQTTYQRQVHGHQEYLDVKFVIWDGCNAEKNLPAGVNRLPFAFNLPMFCPPSFEGSVGYIRYYCKAKIDRPWKFDKTVIQAFTVIPNFDLNTIPYAANPIMKVDSKNLGVVLFKHGRVAVKIILPKSGYVPGEAIDASIEITNNSKKDIEKIDMYLTEIAKFEGRCRAIGVISEFQCDHIAKTHKCRTITKTSQNVIVAPNQSNVHIMNLAIPPIVPSFNNCPIIQVDYKLEVKITAKGHVNNSLCIDLPILLGTYPIRAPIYPVAAATNVPPVPEYLTPPQPTAPSDVISQFFNFSNYEILDGPPPSYAECVFGQGTIALADEDAKNSMCHGFVPKYAVYNTGAQNQAQAPPLPQKGGYPENTPIQGSMPYPTNQPSMIGSGVGPSGLQGPHIGYGASRPQEGYTQGPMGQPSYPYPNVPSYGPTVQATPYPNSPPPYTRGYGPSDASYGSSTNPNAPPLTPESEQTPDLSKLKIDTHL